MGQGQGSLQDEEKMGRARESLCVGEEQEDVSVQLSVSCVGKEM